MAMKICDELVTDGPVKHGRSGYGAVIVQDGRQQTVYGSIKSISDEVSSFRSEAGEVASSLCHHHFLTKTFYCDNLSLVNQLQRDTPLHPLSPEGKLVEPTRVVFNQQNLKGQHVKGHQDEGENPLTQISQYNVVADKLAAKGRASTPLLLTPPGY